MYEKGKGYLSMSESYFEQTAETPQSKLWRYHGYIYNLQAGTLEKSQEQARFDLRCQLEDIAAVASRKSNPETLIDALLPQEELPQEDYLRTLGSIPLKLALHDYIDVNDSRLTAEDINQVYGFALEGVSSEHRGTCTQATQETAHDPYACPAYSECAAKLARQALLHQFDQVDWAILTVPDRSTEEWERKVHKSQVLRTIGTRYSIVSEQELEAIHGSVIDTMHRLSRSVQFKPSS